MLSIVPRTAVSPKVVYVTSRRHLESMMRTMHDCIVEFMVSPVLRRRYGHLRFQSIDEAVRGDMTKAQKRAHIASRFADYVDAGFFVHRHVILLPDLSLLFRTLPLWVFPLAHWDMKHVRRVDFMFAGCVLLNIPLPWDMRQVESAAGLFAGCVSFNQRLAWDLRKCGDVSQLCHGCTSWHLPLDQCRFASLATRHVRILGMLFGTHIPMQSVHFPGASLSPRQLHQYLFANVPTPSHVTMSPPELMEVSALFPHARPNTQTVYAASAPASVAKYTPHMMMSDAALHGAQNEVSSEPWEAAAVSAAAALGQPSLAFAQNVFDDEDVEEEDEEKKGEQHQRKKRNRLSADEQDVLDALAESDAEDIPPTRRLRSSSRISSPAASSFAAEEQDVLDALAESESESELEGVADNNEEALDWDDDWLDDEETAALLFSESGGGGGEHTNRRKTTRCKRRGSKRRRRHDRKNVGRGKICHTRTKRRRRTVRRHRNKTRGKRTQ